MTKMYMAATASEVKPKIPTSQVMPNMGRRTNNALKEVLGR